MFHAYGSSMVEGQQQQRYGGDEAAAAHVRELQVQQMEDVRYGSSERRLRHGQWQHGADQYWSNEETADFIEVRAGMEGRFMVSKRNKALWDAVAGKMKEKGYVRSAEQCKCKWRGLMNRHKELEKLEAQERRRHCPFYDALDAVFTRGHPIAKAGESSSFRTPPAELRQTRPRRSGKRPAAQSLSLSYGANDLEAEEDDHDGEAEGGTGRTHKVDEEGNESRKGGKKSSEEVVVVMRTMLGEFVRQQQRMDAMWRESMERREEWRAAREREMLEAWRSAEQERLAAEERWREMEEQRRRVEEARAEKKEGLLRAILTKLSSPRQAFDSSTT